MRRGINLLPWRERKREEDKKKFLVMIGVFASLSVMITLLIHYVIVSQIDNQLEINDYLKSEISVLDQKIKQIKELQAYKKQLINRTRLIESLQFLRPGIVKIYESFVRDTPKGVVIQAIKRENKTITIQGIAQSNSDISLMLRNIERNEAFWKPTLTEIKANDSDSSYNKTFELKFNEVMYLNNNN